MFREGVRKVVARMTEEMKEDEIRGRHRYSENDVRVFRVARVVVDWAEGTLSSEEALKYIREEV